MFLGTFFGSYLAEAYTTSFNVATPAKATSMALALGGIVALFIATNWTIGLVGIGGELLLFSLFRVFWHKRLSPDRKGD